VLLLASPISVSPKAEPPALLTPAKVSVPTEASPVAVPAAMLTVTAAAALP
jgi:hypothetical protein